MELNFCCVKDGVWKWRDECLTFDILIFVQFSNFLGHDETNSQL